jgi:Flp pilus assembly protein TadG
VSSAPCRILHRRWAADRQWGAAAVEMALVLPILLMLVFGMVDFGLALNAKISLTQAAREGARVRSLGANDAVTIDRVNLALGPMASSSPSPTVTAGPTCPSNASPTAVASVTVTKPYSYVTPIGVLAGLATGPLTLTGTGVMRCLG